MTIEEIQKKLAQSWCKETCYEPQQDNWSPENPAQGQCFVTALIVQDLLGGEIIKAKSSNGVSHYWNVVNDTEIDLTRSQFPDSETFTKKEIINRNQLKENNRYQLLKERFDL